MQADAEKWEGVNKVRNMMKEREVQKAPSYDAISQLGNTWFDNSSFRQKRHFDERLKPNCCKISGKVSKEYNNCHMKMEILYGSRLSQISRHETIEAPCERSCSSAKDMLKSPLDEGHHARRSSPLEIEIWGGPNVMYFTKG